MVTPACPHCHGSTVFAAKCPYCPQCGWNRDVAVNNVRMSIRTIPAGIIVTAAFFAFFYLKFPHSRGGFPLPFTIFFALPPIFYLFGYFSLRRKLDELLALPAMASAATATASGSAGITGTEASGGSTGELSLQYQALLRTSKPREVRMATRGKVSIAIGAFAVLVFATGFGISLYAVWARTLSFANFGPKDWMVLGLAVLILLIPFGMWRGQVRECDLLENGEIAIAQVTRQWSNNNNASISYTFKDYQGQTHESGGFDYTKKLYAGMSIPVFYDRDNPKRQIAYCATLHEVVT